MKLLGRNIESVTYRPIRTLTAILAIILGVMGRVDWWIVVLVLLPMFEIEFTQKLP